MLKLYRDVLHTIILEEFDFDLFVPFLNFQTSSWSNYFVTWITPQELPVVCTEVLHINISDEFDVNIDTVVWPFRNFNLAQGHVRYEQYNFTGIACIMQLYGEGHMKNLGQAEGLEHERCLFLCLK